MTADQFKRAAELLRGQLQTYPQISEDEAGGYVSQDDEEMAQMADELDLAAERIAEKEAAAAEQKRRADLYDELVEALESTHSALHNVLGRRAVHDADEILLRSSSVLAKCKGEKA